MSKTFHADAGKGSNRRVSEVDTETFNNNWDSIFKKKDDKPELELCRCCHNERGVWDCGFWYECPVCTAKE